MPSAIIKVLLQKIHLIIDIHSAVSAIPKTRPIAWYWEGMVQYTRVVLHGIK